MRPQCPWFYIWNNSGQETATLKNASGKTIDARGYTGRSVNGAAQALFKP